jgi:hypothetical protein
LLAAHPDQARKLFDSGCRSAFFGIETFNQRSGQIVGKSGRRDQLIDTLNRIRDKFGSSVNMHGSFVVGLPEETLDSVQETVSWLLDTKNNVLNSFIMHPLRMRSTESARVSDSAFLSDIDQNPGRWGYVIQEPFDDNWAKWTSPWMDYDTAKAICDDTWKKSQSFQEPEGRRLFSIAGLGYTLDDLRGIKVNNAPWDQFAKRKISRQQQIKNVFYQVHNIPNFIKQHSNNGRV